MSRGPGCSISSPGAKPGSGRFDQRPRPVGTSGGKSLVRPVLPVVLAALLLAAVTTGAARGQEPQPPHQPTSVWLYALYKTITYETVANLADIPLYTTVLAGAPGGTALFTAINVATAAAPTTAMRSPGTSMPRRWAMRRARPSGRRSSRRCSIGW
jgi:hypothetical protein